MEVTIPNEVLFDILFKIENINDVMNLCATNKIIQAVCDDDYFWKHRFELDYPDLSPITPTG